MNYVCFLRGVNTVREIIQRGGNVRRIGTIWIEYWSPNGIPLTPDSYLDK